MENTNDERPSFFNDNLVAYDKALRVFTLGLTKGNAVRAEEVYASAVVDMLTHWRAYDPSRAGFYAWARWRIRGKISNMAKHNAVHCRAFNDFVEVSSPVYDNTANDSQREGENVWPSTEPTQADHVELKLLLERIRGMKHGEDFIRLALGDTLREIADGRVSPQAIEQRMMRFRKALSKVID